MANDADDELFDRLAATLRGAEESPAHVVELARASFGLHRLDAELAELAELVADSALDRTPAGLRDGGHSPRMLTFEAGDAEIEVQVTVAGPAGWQGVGQVVPPAPAAVRVEPADPALSAARAAGGRARAAARIEPADPALSAADAQADELGRFAARLTGGGPWRLVWRRHGLPPV